MVSLARKSTLLLFIALFVAVSVGGVFASQTLMKDGTMEHCPFMGVPALCDMSPLAHLAQWQESFTALLQIFVVALAAAVYVWALFFLVPIRNVRIRPSPLHERFFSPLRLAFARGIVHTKVY